MSTLPPPHVQKSPADSLESKVYSLVEKYSENIPIPNDRNRLAFNLYNYLTGEGDPPAILVNSAKIKVEGIEKEQLAKLLEDELAKLK